MELDAFLDDFAHVQLALGGVSGSVGGGIDFDFMSGLGSHEFTPHGALGSPPLGANTILQLSDTASAAVSSGAWARPNDLMSEADEAFNPHHQVLHVLDDDDQLADSSPSAPTTAVSKLPATSARGAADALVLLALGPAPTPSSLRDQLVELAVNNSAVEKVAPFSARSAAARRSVFRRYFRKRSQQQMVSTRAEPATIAALVTLCLNFGEADIRESQRSNGLLRSLEALCCHPQASNGSVPSTDARTQYNASLGTAKPAAPTLGIEASVQNLTGICLGTGDKEAKSAEHFVASPQPPSEGVPLSMAPVAVAPLPLPAYQSEPPPYIHVGFRPLMGSLTQLLRTSIAEGKRFAASGHQTPYYAAAQHLASLLEKGTALYGRLDIGRRMKMGEADVELETERVLLSGWLFGVALNLAHSNLEEAFDLAEAAVKFTQNSVWGVETFQPQSPEKLPTKAHFRFIANSLATFGLLFEPHSWCIANTFYTLARRRAVAVGYANPYLDQTLVDGDAFAGRDPALRGADLTATGVLQLDSDPGIGEVPSVALQVFR